MSQKMNESVYKDVYTKYLKKGCSMSIYDYAMETAAQGNASMAKEIADGWDAIKADLIAEDNTLNELAVLVFEKNKCYRNLTESNLQRIAKVETLIKNKRAEIASNKVAKQVVTRTQKETKNTQQTGQL